MGAGIHVSTAMIKRRRSKKEKDYNDLDSDNLNPCPESHNVAGSNPAPARLDQVQRANSGNPLEDVRANAVDRLLALRKHGGEGMPNVK